MALTNGRKVILFETPEEDYQKMLQMIRDGAWDHVAAGVIGIAPETFTQYKRFGRAAKEKKQLGEKLTPYEERFLKFLLDVHNARCEARQNAESRVHKDNPSFWLRVGPGRDTGSDEPGWTERSEVKVSGDLNLSTGAAVKELYKKETKK